MIVVIIAGGSGTRLWPLSKANYPKHLLKLTGQKSLLQNTYQRSKLIASNIYVVTEKSHADEVAKQLPELGQGRIVIEPGRRGTASCITLALAQISKHESADEPIIFLHADHHISDEKKFADTVKAAAKASEKHQRITLIGIQPTYPATGLGYMEVGGVEDKSDGFEIFNVIKFTEKPELETAKKYLGAGNYLWNLGLFAAPLKVFVDRMQKHAPDLFEAYSVLSSSLGDEKKLADNYLGLPSQPIDTVLIEPTPDLLVVGGRFEWADIGSFFDLHKVLSDSNSNTIRGDVQLIDSDDVMVMSHDKPVVVIGLSGVIVVDTPDGLLVCSKEQSQQVGEAAKKIAAREKSEAY